MPFDRIAATCSKCGAPIMTAVNRRHNTKCDACRVQSIRDYNAAYERKRKTPQYKADHAVKVGDVPTCPVCNQTLAQGHCKCDNTLTDEQAAVDYARWVARAYPGRGRNRKSA